MHSPVDFQGVEHREWLVHAHGHFRFGQPLAFDQGQVHSQVGLVTEGMGGELAVRSLKWAATNAFNQRLVAAAVLDWFILIGSYCWFYQRQFGTIPLPGPSMWFLAATWQVMDTVTLRAGVNNVLDDNPQLSYSVGTTGNGNTYPQVYDSLGRYFFFGVTANF